MSFVVALRALAVAGPLSSRAFLPLFVLAAIARWPEAITWVPLCPDPPVVLPHALEWMASGWGLTLLGVLALLEVSADKDPDARRALELVTPVLKTGAALVAAVLVLDPESARALRVLAHADVATAGVGGATWAGALVLAAGTITFLLQRWRALMLEHVRD